MTEQEYFPNVAPANPDAVQSGRVEVVTDPNTGSNPVASPYQSDPTAPPPTYVPPVQPTQPPNLNPQPPTNPTDSTTSTEYAQEATKEHDAFNLEPPKKLVAPTQNPPAQQEPSGPTVEDGLIAGVLVSDGKMVGLTIHTPNNGKKYLATLPIKVEIDNTGD